MKGIIIENLWILHGYYYGSIANHRRNGDDAEMKLFMRRARKLKKLIKQYEREENESN